MYTQLKRVVLLTTVIVGLIAAGCGPKAVPQTSTLDTPEYHYSQGLKYFAKDQFDDAMREFQRAVDLDPKSPLGYIGRGLVFGQKEDFKSAYENMEKAKSLENKGIEARIGMIRLYSLQMVKEPKKAKDLIKDAESEFNSANDKDPNNARLHYIWEWRTRQTWISTRLHQCSAPYWT